jgi:hypothetical protein
MFADLPKKLWDEAVRAIYIITNFHPSNQTLDRIPNELFSSIKSNQSNLFAFNSLAYIYNTT